jgi:hypothetical protein
MTRHKYNVAPKEQRMFRGRLYASKAERDYAEILYTWLADGSVDCIIEQPKRVWFDGAMTYTPDFLVVHRDGDAEFIDVKGVETAQFRRVIKAWPKAETLSLVVVKRNGKNWKCTVFDGGPGPTAPESSAHGPGR